MESENLFTIKKRAYIRSLLLFFFSIVSSAVFCQSFPYKFNYLTVDEGLSHTDANDVTQDNKGYIWVATNFGLDRYDGYALKKYYNNNVPVKNAFKNRIMRVNPDAFGNIWLCTEDGLQSFNPKTEKYIDYSPKKGTATPIFWKVFKPKGNLVYSYGDFKIRLFAITGNVLTEQSLSAPADVRFFDMQQDRNGVLYFASDKGLWKLDNNRRFIHIPLAGMQGTELTNLFFDNQNNLLVTVKNKVFLTARVPGPDGTGNALRVKRTFTGGDQNTIQGITAGRKSEYWVNTGSGLVRLDRDLNFIQLIDSKSQHSLNSSVLIRAFIDRSDCLWVGTSGGGVNFCDLNQKLFYTIQHIPGERNSLSGNHIRSVLEDGENLWIGTNANGLNLYNARTQSFTNYNTYDSKVRLKNNMITALSFDNDHNLWIGSESGIEILRPDKKTFWKPPGYEAFPKYLVGTLAKDYYGNIWFGNLDKYGVIWKDKSNRYHVKEYAEGHFILTDQAKPQLFISSRQGVKQILVDHEGNINKTIHYRASSKPNSISSNYTSPIAKQNDSTYWIGTIGGGLNRLLFDENNTAYHIKLFGTDYGVFNDVEAIEIDRSGNIWMGGTGLQYLNPKTGKLIRYDKNDGLQGNSFKIRASFKGEGGRLYFGGINGLNYFYPDQIKVNNIDARPVLTDMLINNTKTEYGKPGSSKNAISEAIGYSDGMTLSYLQNNFVISFSAMHFANPLKCKYRYKLLGFDTDWNFTDGLHPSAAYSNLDYKNYTFIVEATNNDGIWGKSRAETAIMITPPWWKSNIAKLIYALLVISALAGVYIYQARWYRLKREIAVRAIDERKRDEMHRQREELYQQQLTFFTNISHEFRTPLTLILGPLESLISQNKNAVLDNSYQMMLRNAKRLFNLISELMNFKKLADSLIKLQVQPLMVNQFCKDLALEFQDLATSKQITLKMTDYTERNVYWPLTGLFDVQILEKILLNLLNNSFKYTEAGGQVSFEIFTDINKFKPSFDTGFELLFEEHRANKYLYFRVADTGIGIASDAVTRIFDRYYRISRDQLGSGVGLALVKSLTQLHKGDIYVYSERNKGTEIIIGIPLGEENYEEAERAPVDIEPEVKLEMVDNSILKPLTAPAKGRVQATSGLFKHILIVDDNEELRMFLKQTFEKHYYIYEAEDGNAALEIAAEKVPDLIISDVMMPGMNGIELCKLVKERFETSHIPFIILSAKDALATKIEGMESGADYYFAKPLSVDLLLLTVHNIFEQSEKLKLRYTNNYLTEATELVHSEKDKEFFHALLSLIEDNMQDPELDVDFLCKHLFTSRTKLYQKIKSITDQSVGDFIRTIRLKKAIQIMTHEDIALNKVVDRVGLQSSSNFSRVFKKEYGKSPLQFMQSLKKNQVPNE
jgi:signal transduction histidine kinase/DNA-binding response OmpR family regulator/ligand-binding sensor domain-containing protein